VSCGNGIIDADVPDDDQPIEECDDGNDIDDDECTNTCRRNQYDVSRSDFTGPLEPVQGEVFFPLGDDQTISFRIPSTSSGEPRYTYLFNKRYDGVRVSSNGLIGLLENTGLPPSHNFEEPSSAEGPLGQGRSFTTYQGNGCCSGQPIPSPVANTPLIAPYWEDLLGIYQLGLVSDPASGLSADSAGNSVALLSEGGRDWLVVEWRGVSHFGGGPGGLHMQALLRIFTDGSPEQNILNQEEAVVKLRCLNCQSDGGAHTQGLQGSRPYQGATLTTTDTGPVYRSATSWSITNEQVTFTPHAR
jgi:cysteine-rich repeat protein